MQKPNIVWLNVDHIAYAHHFDLHREFIRTTAFDRLNAEGTGFENAYTVCPLCTPARASLVTGQYPHRHGIHNNEGAFGSRTSFREDAPLYSEDLRAAGYRCAFFGKWHAVGTGGGTAQDHGFEGWTLPGYGFPYRAPEYAEYLQERGLPEPVVDVDWHWDDPTKTGRVRLLEEPDALYRMGSSGVFLSPKETHEAYFVTHLANQYLEERAREQQSEPDSTAPFCLRVDTWGPHHPYWVAAPFAGTVEPEALPPYPNFTHDLADRPAHHRRFQEQVTARRGPRDWAEWQPVLARCYEHIALVDDALNTVLQTLDHLNLSENTLVIYSADHGDIFGAHGGLWDKGWLMVEETMRIPLAARWPGQIAAGQRSAALVSNLDIVAMLRHAAGAAESTHDGQSLLSPAREDLMSESHGHYARHVFQRMLRHAQWKYVAHLDDLDELYDLQADPYEMTNRAADPALAAVRRDLRDRLRRQMEYFDDDAPEARRLRKQLESS